MPPRQSARYFLSGLGLLLASGIAIAAGGQSATPDRHQVVGGWTIDDVANPDIYFPEDAADRIVRVTRSTPRYEITYIIEISANARGVGLRRYEMATSGPKGSCSRSGAVDETMNVVPEERAPSAAETEKGLAGQVAKLDAQCGSPAGIAEALAGFAPAFAVAAAWTKERLAAFPTDEEVADDALGNDIYDGSEALDNAVWGNEADADPSDMSAFNAM